MEETLRKVLTSYGLVKDNEPLNGRLIERVIKIIMKEFEVKNKFDADDGPISISNVSSPDTKTIPTGAAPVNKAQAHFAKTIANVTKNNPKLEGIKQAIKETFEKQDPPISEPDSEDVVEEGGVAGDEGQGESEAGVEMVLDTGAAIPPTHHRITAAKLDDSAEQRVTQSGVRSIRRLD